MVKKDKWSLICFLLLFNISEPIKYTLKLVYGQIKISKKIIINSLLI